MGNQVERNKWQAREIWMIEIVQRVLTEYWCEFMVARSEESGNQEQWSNFVGESLEDWKESER